MTEDSPDPADERHVAILEAALKVLQREGYAATTMLQIATEAGASKATLYGRFESKQALFAALVQHTAANANERLAAALAAATDVEATLADFAFGLLKLLTGDTSLSLNRAAAGELQRAPELGQTVFAHGRQSTGRLMTRYLQQAREDGALQFDAADDAFEVLIGLAVGDLQVRLLIGAAQRPSEKALRLRAQRAARQFMALYGAR